MENQEQTQEGVVSQEATENVEMGTTDVIN